MVAATDCVAPRDENITLLTASVTVAGTGMTGATASLHDDKERPRHPARSNLLVGENKPELFLPFERHELAATSISPRRA